MTDSENEKFFHPRLATSQRNILELYTYWDAMRGEDDSPELAKFFHSGNPILRRLIPDSFWVEVSESRIILPRFIGTELAELLRVSVASIILDSLVLADVRAQFSDLIVKTAFVGHPLLIDIDFGEARGQKSPNEFLFLPVAATGSAAFVFGMLSLATDGNAQPKLSLGRAAIHSYTEL